MAALADVAAAAAVAAVAAVAAIIHGPKTFREKKVLSHAHHFLIVAASSSEQEPLNCGGAPIKN